MPHLTRRLMLALAASLLMTTASPSSAADWPGFRGDGTATTASLPTELPSAKPLWSLPVEGTCQAGLAVADNALILIDYAEAKHDAYRCIDPQTGKERWNRRFDNDRKMEYGAAPRVTPLIHNKKVYVLSAFGELYCLDLATGKTLWEKKYADAYAVEAPPEWGFCTSPIIAKGKLIIHPGGKGGLVALNPDTGEQIWSSPKSEPNYASLLVATFGGVEQVVAVEAPGLAGFDLATGKRLWRVPLEASANYIVPTAQKIGDNLFYSYQDKGCMLFSFGKDGVINKEPIAAANDPAPEICTPVVAGSTILGTAKALTALSAKDLSVLFADEEEPAFGSECHLIAAGSTALALTPTGTAVFFTFDGKAAKVTSKTKLCGATQSHPAIANDVLFVRDGKTLQAFSLKK